MIYFIILVIVVIVATIIFIALTAKQFNYLKDKDHGEYLEGIVGDFTKVIETYKEELATLREEVTSPLSMPMPTRSTYYIREEVYEFQELKSQPMIIHDLNQYGGGKHDAIKSIEYHAARMFAPYLLEQNLIEFKYRNEYGQGMLQTIMEARLRVLRPKVPYQNKYAHLHKHN
jgi:hypothetical protein